MDEQEKIKQVLVSEKSLEDRVQELGAETISKARVKSTLRDILQGDELSFYEKLYFADTFLNEDFEEETTNLMEMMHPGEIIAYLMKPIMVRLAQFSDKDTRLDVMFNDPRIYFYEPALNDMFVPDKSSIVKVSDTNNGTIWNTAYGIGKNKITKKYLIAMDHFFDILREFNVKSNPVSFKEMYPTIVGVSKNEAEQDMILASMIVGRNEGRSGFRSKLFTDDLQKRVTAVSTYKIAYEKGKEKKLTGQTKEEMEIYTLLKKLSANTLTTIVMDYPQNRGKEGQRMHPLFVTARAKTLNHSRKKVALGTMFFIKFYSSGFYKPVFENLPEYVDKIYNQKKEAAGGKSAEKTFEDGKYRFLLEASEILDHNITNLDTIIDRWSEFNEMAQAQMWNVLPQTFRAKIVKAMSESQEAKFSRLNGLPDGFYKYNTFNDLFRLVDDWFGLNMIYYAYKSGRGSLLNDAFEQLNSILSSGDGTIMIDPSVEIEWQRYDRQGAIYEAGHDQIIRIDDPRYKFKEDKYGEKQANNVSVEVHVKQTAGVIGDEILPKVGHSMYIDSRDNAMLEWFGERGNKTQKLFESYLGEKISSREGEGLISCLKCNFEEYQDHIKGLFSDFGGPYGHDEKGMFNHDFLSELN